MDAGGFAEDDVTDDTDDALKYDGFITDRYHKD